MKRVLLIALVFPPAPSPGALRPGYLARYLPQFGWDVTVLTTTAQPPPFPARVVSTQPRGTSFEQRIRSRVQARAQNPNGLLRVALRRLKESLLFPDTTAGWIPPAVKAGLHLLRSEHFDAILSTAHPPSAHVIAWILSRASGVPWIADYRDPWAGNAYMKRGPIRRLLERLLELGMLRRASALSAIDEPIAAGLRKFHRRDDVHVIANAYDPADWEDIPQAEPARFDLCFTGSMYDGKRSPDLLFHALAELRAEHDPAGSAARVHFYGANSGNVDVSASRYGLNLIARQHGVVPRSQAMLAQRSAAVLLIFLNMDPATSREMGSKFLEYIGARRPILAFGPRESVMRGFIEHNQLGWFASDVAEAKEGLRAAYRRFSTGAYELRIDSRRLMTARALACEFSDILDRAAGAHAAPPLHSAADQHFG
jgi:Glycosyltransferase Family 4